MAAAPIWQRPTPWPQPAPWRMNLAGTLTGPLSPDVAVSGVTTGQGTFRLNYEG